MEIIENFIAQWESVVLNSHFLLFEKKKQVCSQEI